MLSDYLSQVRGLDNSAMEAARARVDSLVKPPGSLGKLEDIAIQLAGISGDMFYDAGKRCVVIMASDNGVVEEGVAAAPQSVTQMMAINFTKGITGVSALAKQFGADLRIIDVGINADVTNSQIEHKKIRKSTHNIAERAAMSRDEAIRAILTGIEIAIQSAKNGYKLLGAGEMGIGNTTTSAAVLCALAGIAPEQAAGKGAGLSDDAYLRKIDVIRTALKVNRPEATDPIGVIEKVGGFDIAALAGLFIGGALSRIPVVIDGFISMVAALVAIRICPMAREFMIASHASFEQGYAHAARAVGIEPSLNLNMRLGEGSGCPIMFAVIDAACAMMRDMATFEQAAIDGEYLEKVKGGDNFTV